MTIEEARSILRNAAWLGTNEDRERIEGAVELLCGEPCKELPSAQHEPSEITDEQAIRHLQSTGWMQNHDREMYESGLREKLADDSGSYDSLILCEDAISRQASIDALKKHFSDDDSIDTECGAYWHHGHVIDVLQGMPSVTPKQSGWHYTDLPPSDDPYKRYLVVYSPYDRNYGRNTAPRFEIADYYKGDGLYNDKPWHLTISHSVMEKEILAWKDIGIVDEVMQGAKMFEPQERNGV